MPKLIGSGRMVKSSFNLASIISTVLLATISFVIMNQWVSGLISIVAIFAGSLILSILVFRDRLDVVTSAILFFFREWKTDARVRDPFSVNLRNIPNLKAVLENKKFNSHEVE